MADTTVLTVIKGHEGVSLLYTCEHLAAMTNADDFLATISHEPQQIIVMNSSGSPLVGERLSSLLSTLAASALDKSAGSVSTRAAETLYAFERRFLSPTSPDEAYATLGVVLGEVLESEPPHVHMGTASHADLIAVASAHHRIAGMHHDTSVNLVAHIRALKAGLSVALANLARSVEGHQDVLEAFESFARGSVEDYGAALDAYEPALALARRIRLHPVFSATTTGASSSRQKHLIGFVLQDKMAGVHSACVKAYGQFRAQFEGIREAATRITTGMAEISDNVNGSNGDLEDLFELEQDVHDGLARTDHAVSIVTETPPEDTEELVAAFEELKVLDEDARERVAFLVERKNYWIQVVIGSLNDISSMQASLPLMKTDVQSLNDGLRTRATNFRHLGRLRNLVKTYAAILVEIVRRREFAQHLIEHASALSEVLVKLSADEERRRRNYRNEYTGLLPFDVPALDDVTVPAAEVNLRSPPLANGFLSLTRADIDDLVVNLGEADDDDVAVHAVRDVLAFVAREMDKLEAIEAAFASAAEKMVLPASQLLAHSQQSHSPAAARVETEQLRTTNSALEADLSSLRRRFEEGEREHDNTKVAHQEALEQLATLQMQTIEASESRTREREDLALRLTEATEHAHREAGEKAAASTRVAELERELADHSRAAVEAERQLISARATAVDATRELQELQTRHTDHLSDYSALKLSLQSAHEQIEQLKKDVFAAREEAKSATERLTEKSRELGEQRLAAQCDRAVLEDEIQTLKESAAALEANASSAAEREASLQAKIASSRRNKERAVEKATADLQSQLREADVQNKATVASLSSKATAALSIAQRLRLSQDRILSRLATMPAPSASHRRSSEVVSSTLRTITEDGDVPSAESTAFDVLLADLRAVDTQAFGTTVQEKADGLSQTVRKWMKECKGYRERAKTAQELARHKIAVQEFGAGDLALFLPTRDSTARIWAAFNVGSPHYFLRPSERIVELTKRREWLVARISEVEACGVTPQAPTSNPFSLPAGTRYFLLDVDAPYVPERLSRSPPKAHLSPPPGGSAAQPSTAAVTASDVGTSSKSAVSSPSKAVTTLGLGQSEFTVINAEQPPPSSPADSPFLSLRQRAKQESPTAASRHRPSGVSLGLARSRDRLSETLPASSQPSADDDALDFQPSESARPAFLPSGSVISTTSSRPAKAPLVAPPTRRRPVPRATNVSRAGSRPSSVASSAMRPSVAALFKPGSSAGKATPQDIPTASTAAVGELSQSPYNPPSPGLSSSYLGSWRRKPGSGQGASELLRRFSGVQS